MGEPHSSLRAGYPKSIGDDVVGLAESGVAGAVHAV